MVAPIQGGDRVQVRVARNTAKCLSRVAVAETVLGWQVVRLRSRTATIVARIGGHTSDGLSGNGTGPPLRGSSSRIPWWNSTRWVLLSAAR